MIERESRAFEFEIRAEQKESNIGQLTGIPIVFEQASDLGFYTEVISREALNEADLRDVKFLVNHDTSKIPLARSRNNNANSTMQFTVEDDGMHIRVDLDTENNTDARNLYSAVSRGDISGMSFMFTVAEDSWQDVDSNHPTRTINKIGRVFEVSAVTFPAYEQTSISARAAETLESAKAALESAKHKAELEAWKNEMRSML